MKFEVCECKEIAALSVLCDHLFCYFFWHPEVEKKETKNSLTR